MEKEIQWLLEEKYKGKVTKQFYKDAERLKAGEPVDYVIGFTEFLGIKIDLSKKPLIPRQETAFWVQEVIKQINGAFVAHKEQNFLALDIFAGSGCIGLAVLKYIKNSQVDFADIDENAIKQIKINLKNNFKNKPSLIRANKRLKVDRFRVVKSDVFSNVEGKYDFIFANPPYISKKNKKLIQESVLKFEPKNALFAGIDGLFYIKKFLENAKEHLKLDGNIFMEFSPEQKPAIEKLIKKLCYSKYKFYRDQFGRYRWVVVCK